MFGNDYYYDVDSELYYCATRWYNPLWCRFISGDDIRYFNSENIGCVNMFAYCNNNPVMIIDSYGNTPRWISMLGGMIEHSASTIAGLLKLSLKAMPELSKQVAIKIARKGGWQQTAREIVRSRSNNIAETNKMISQAESVAKWTGRPLLVIDIVSTTISNYKRGSKS